MVSITGLSLVINLNKKNEDFTETFAYASEVIISKHQCRTIKQPHIVVVSIKFSDV